MKSAQLEILLFTDTRFSSRQFCEKYDTGNQKNSAAFKELEDACWNGVLHEMLPEIYWDTESNKKLFLWKVTQAHHFLQLEYAEWPCVNEWAFSLNPYSLLWMGKLS